MHSYILALVLIGLVVVLLASWFGIYLARGITVPIKCWPRARRRSPLAISTMRFRRSATTRSANWSNSFNRMTADLRASRAELERRRALHRDAAAQRFGAGSSGSTRDGGVTAINPCAERMLGLSARRSARPPYARRVSARAGPRRSTNSFAEHRRPHEVRSSIKFGGRRQPRSS